MTVNGEYDAQMSNILQIRSYFTEYGRFPSSKTSTNPASYSPQVKTIKRVDFFPVSVDYRDVGQN
jgi:hypothetical protein